MLFRWIIFCSGGLYGCSGGLYAVQEGYIYVQEGCILFRGLICCSEGYMLIRSFIFMFRKVVYTVQGGYMLFRWIIFCSGGLYGCSGLASSFSKVTITKTRKRTNEKEDYNIEPDLLIHRRLVCPPPTRSKLWRAVVPACVCVAPVIPCTSRAAPVQAWSTIHCLVRLGGTIVPPVNSTATLNTAPVVTGPRIIGALSLTLQSFCREVGTYIVYSIVIVLSKCLSPG